jgi:hypothetical protein
MRTTDHYHRLLLTDNGGARVGEPLAELNESKSVHFEGNVVCYSAKSVELFLGGIFSLDIFVAFILILNVRMCRLSFNYERKLGCMVSSGSFMVKVWRQGKRGIKLCPNGSVVNISRHFGIADNEVCEMWCS